MVQNDLQLDAGTRLIHVGAHKTGTTAVQGAFHRVRERLPEHGVTYFGPAPGATYLEGALAVAGRRGQRGRAVPDMRHWTALTADVAAQGDRRVLVSSAYFGDADAETTRRVVEGLGGSPVHAVVTLRPLAKILPSQWQQFVQNGLTLRYPDWLDSMLNRPRAEVPPPVFWQRHRHDELVSRWAAAAGPDNVTVIVVDESDRLRLLRMFERMLGLPDRLLELVSTAANRSLTPGEVELIRLLNEEAKRQDWPDRAYARLVRGGAVRHLLAGYQPSPGEQRIATPPWALKRAAEIGAEMAASISALGVRVVGDISELGRAPAARAEETGVDAPQAAPVIAAEAASAAVLGVIVASGVPDQLAAASKPRPVADRPVREVTARSLVGVLVKRGRRRVRSTLRRLGRPAGPVHTGS